MASRKKMQERKRSEVRDVTDQLMELRSMSVGDLRHRYEELFGAPTGTRNKAWLQKKVAWRIQELAEGGLSERATAKIDELAEDAPARHNRRAGDAEPDASDRDPRLPPVGAVLTRAYKGADHRVMVLGDGFEYEGRTFRSLSAIALEITGTVWNGHRFFRLVRPRAQGAVS